MVALCMLVLIAGCAVGAGTLPVVDEPTETPTETVPTPQHPTTPSSSLYDVDVDKIEDLIHQKMNERRRENGVEPLERNETLDAIARYKSWDMAQRDYFAHTGPNGTRHNLLRDRYGAKCDHIGQNIARHSFDLKNPYPYPQSELSDSIRIASGIVRGFLNSPGHRQNALSTYYESQGIGVFVDENGTVFVTQELCG